jgi:DNA-3-methyladenine glycosylase I
MRAYHDDEWGKPLRNSRALWELLVLEGFQAGLSWQTVLNKREAFRTAFKGFVPEVVATFTEADLETMLQNPGIIRARAKLKGAVTNAQAYVRMAENGEDFATWAWNFVNNTPLPGTFPLPAQTPLSATISKELKKRGFTFVGPVIVYSWMQAAGLVNDHEPGCISR